MKKRIISIVLVVALILVTMSMLTACGDAPIANVEEKFIEGMSASITGLNPPQVYKYKEKMLGDDLFTYTTVNVLPLMNDGKEDKGLKNQPVLGADGKLKNIKVEIIDESTVGKGDNEIYEYVKYNAGLSESGIKDMTDKEYLFKNKLVGKDKYDKTKQDITTQAFLDSDLFATYALSTKLAELAFLSFDDLDFTIKEASHTIKGEITKLKFSVKDSYFDKLDAEFGDDKVSIFDNANHVGLEFRTGKLSMVTTYEESLQGEMFGSPLYIIKETYSLMITYFGPKIDIPEYAALNSDKQPTWTNATIA